MSIIKILTIIFCSIIIAQAKTPDWYNNAPLDTKDYYYATASGETLKDATNEALSQIASQIQVTINSSFDKITATEQINDKETYSKKVSKNVKTKVDDVSFNNFNIVKSFVDEDGRTYILLELDKSKLLVERTNQFKELDNKINLLFQELDFKHTAEKVKNILELKQLIVNAKKNLSFMLSVANDDKTSKKEYFGKYTMIENRINEIFNNTKISFYTKNKDLVFATEIMEDFVSKLGIKTLVYKNNMIGDDLIIVTLDGDLSFKKNYGNFNHFLTLKFTITDVNEVYLINTKQIESSGTYDFKSSFRLLKDNLKEKISDTNVMNFIGF